VQLAPKTWASLIEDLEKEYPKLQPGTGSDATMMTGGGTFEYSYLRMPPPKPACPTCEAEWAFEDVPTGTSGSMFCHQCGRATPTYPAPDWLKAVIPTATQVFFGDGPEGGTGGQTSLSPDEASSQPIALACPQCAGGLMITAQTERTTRCNYCSVDVYLPDGVWNKLHPAKVAKYWLVRFEGDFRALKAELKARKEAAKAAEEKDKKKDKKKDK
jgi:uncharacterized protein YbaR (Trm112 family)